ncbi:MAG: hypothetical protein WDN24_00220 [Sphingomonas sp.]
MRERRKRLIDYLDAAAESTGIPKLMTGQPRRRHLRWLPAIPIALGSAGLLVPLMRGDLQPLGIALMCGTLGLSMLLPLMGPVKPWGGAEKADEFDRTVRARAYFATFATISIAAVTGIWLLLGLALLNGWPRETMFIGFSQLSTYLLVLYASVPTLHASWATRPIDEED